MKLPTRSLQFILMILFLSAAGCTTITPYTGGEMGASHSGGEIATPDGGAVGTTDSGDAIGVLQVSGPNVWLNDAPAADGAPVYLGNSLATGAGSSAIVLFADGGFLQLQENTDPLFEWLEQSKCLLIRIVKGQVYLKKSQTCVEGPDISMILNSEVNVNIPPPPAPTEVTVIRGTAEVTLPTRRIKLVQGEQLRATLLAPEVKTLSRDEVRLLAKWKEDYRFKQLRTPIKPRRIKPSGTKPPRVAPERVDPDAVAPDVVAPERVAPERIAPDMVAPDMVAPERIAPAPVTPERVMTTPETDPKTLPVIMRPVRIPGGVLRPKSAPVPENVQPEPELK